MNHKNFHRNYDCRQTNIIFVTLHTLNLSHKEKKHIRDLAIDVLLYHYRPNFVMSADLTSQKSLMLIKLNQ